MSRLRYAVAALSLIIASPRLAYAQVSRIVIDSVVSPAFGGASYGTAGQYETIVPVVLRDTPLGTYIGWNITSSGFCAGRLCSYAAGMIPFATTRAERLASGDPRLSLEERYNDHAGYVQAVLTAAANAVDRGFLLPADAAALVAAAVGSSVLR